MINKLNIFWEFWCIMFYTCDYVYSWKAIKPSFPSLTILWLLLIWYRLWISKRDKTLSEENLACLWSNLEYIPSFICTYVCVCGLLSKEPEWTCDWKMIRDSKCVWELIVMLQSVLILEFNSFLWNSYFTNNLQNFIES